MAKAGVRKKKEDIKFSKSLILFNYFLDLFGFDDFLEAKNLLARPEYIGVDSSGNSKFLNIILSTQSHPKLKLSEDELTIYDQNIIKASSEISEKREHTIQWQYFQYLCLMFSEIYLDRYLSNPDSLLSSINKYGIRFAEKLNSTLDPEKINAYRFQSYISEDLKKLAFWSATGSGKTLLMHIHIKQMLYYLNKYNKRKLYNQILLITTNESLSKQHIDELALSKISSIPFNKGNLSTFKDHIKVIEITKLADQSGDKTVAVDCFESNNIIFVDEGHRGSSGEEWSARRNALANKGFTFEYSATFAQAVNKDKKLALEYSKAIIFDYSYKHFYGDGFGKDYKVLNLKEHFSELKYKYLIACLLSYYQQKKIYIENKGKAKKFNLENPLCVFVGHSVNAVKEVKDGSKKIKISDVKEVLLFLSRFTSAAYKEDNLKIISEILMKGLPEKDGRNIFSNYFSYLNQDLLVAESVYLDILKKIFNSDVPARIRVADIKEADGEISLSLGSQSQPFGLINVGDAKPLLDLLSTDTELIIAEVKNFTGSLFNKINLEDSSINILIGSKKFTEGWNSYRVSTMGLLNVGQKEGTQIIQLFGRGVRLKGHPDLLNNSNFSLKRHEHLSYLGLKADKDIKYLETLNVFGIEADYMTEFKKYLEDEEVKSEEDEFEEITMPVITNHWKDKLKVLTLKEGIDFKKDKDAPRPTLQLDLEVFKKMNTVSLNYYSKIDFAISKEIKSQEIFVGLNQASLSEEHLAFLDYMKIYFDLQNFKNEKAWFNLNINLNSIYSILKNNDWYTLYIPNEYLDYTEGFKYLYLWQDIAQILMRKYVEKFYLYHKNEYEKRHREYKELGEDSDNLIKEYQILINKEHEGLIHQINNINELVKAGKVPSVEQTAFTNGKFIFSNLHLYQPLIFIDGKSSDNDNVIIVKPSALNRGEAEFVHKLERFALEKSSLFKDTKFYLLRNQSRGKGLGFWEAANFYPDFIFWIVKEDKQYISFIDPKGIRNLNIKDKKVEFFKTIKEIEKEMNNSAVILNSFLISVKAYKELAEQWINHYSKDQLKDNHILFIEDRDLIEQLINRSMNSLVT